MILYAVIVAIFGHYKNLVILLFVTSIFTTTAVINISTNSITVPHLIALLFILKIFVGIFTNKLKIYRPNLYLSMFFIYCCFSIFFPAIFTGGIKLVGSSQYSMFGTQVIYQIIYLVLSFLIFWGTETLYKNNLINKNMINIAIDKTFFVTIFLSVFQLTNKSLFNLLFVNKINTKFIQRLESGESRLTCTFYEPSMFALLLNLFLIYFTFRAMENKKYYIYIIVTIILGIISTASTFYIGCFGWILLLVYLNRKKINNLLIVFILFIFGFLWIEYRFNNIITSQLSILFYKIYGKGTSGNMRMQEFKDCLNIFFHFPLTGIGFGLNRSADLFSTWLSNIGLIGLILFWIFMVKICKLETSLIRFKNNIEIIAIKVSLIALFITMFIAVTEPYYNFLWFLAGVASSSKNNRIDILD